MTVRKISVGRRLKYYRLMGDIEAASGIPFFFFYFLSDSSGGRKEFIVSSADQGSDDLSQFRVWGFPGLTDRPVGQVSRKWREEDSPYLDKISYFSTPYTLSGNPVIISLRSKTGLSTAVERKPRQKRTS